MLIPRTYLLPMLGVLFVGAPAAAEEPSHDQSFVCATLCPGSACPQRCKPASHEAPTKRTDADGPGRGAYEAAEPRQRLKLNPDK
jgi:hypothetical protein